MPRILRVFKSFLDLFSKFHLFKKIIFLKILRVSGSFERIDKLRRQYDLSHNVELSQEEDIHTGFCLNF